MMIEIILATSSALLALIFVMLVCFIGLRLKACLNVINSKCDNMLKTLNKLTGNK